MSHYQYLLLLAGCVVLTLPLEVVLGARVWRRPRRLALALAGPVVVFTVWDVLAVRAHWWRYARRYVTGVDLPGHLPVEELAFFVVIPICALLTFEVVSGLLEGKAPLRRPGRRRSGTNAG